MVYVTHDQIEAMTLATRIAVLCRGRVKQLGTPEEVYRRPASLFVADFVGSPGMNLIAGRIELGRVVADGNARSWLVPRDCAVIEGQEVTLGIRPEEVGVVPDGSEGAVTAQVEVVELTGPEKQGQLQLGHFRITASLPPTTRIEPGAVCAIVFDPAAILLFDSNCGQRIGPT